MAHICSHLAIEAPSTKSEETRPPAQPTAGSEDPAGSLPAAPPWCSTKASGAVESEGLSIKVAANSVSKLSSGRRSRWGTKAAEPLAKRSRWGAKAQQQPPPNPLQTKLEEVSRLIEGDALPSEEREVLVKTRTQLVMKMVAEQQRKLQVDMGLMPLQQPQQMMCKVMLQGDTCPGGVQSLVGLVIGARGTTQQMLQEQSGCRVVVRGRGSNKTKTIFGEEEEEDTHVLITGPNEDAVNKARQLVMALIDFNSDEGEKMRQESRRKGQVLNGTLREDKDVELRHLLFSGEKAKGGGAFGKTAPWQAAATAAAAPAPWLAGAAPPDGSKEVVTEDEYARLMAEVNELSGPASDVVPDTWTNSAPEAAPQAEAEPDAAPVPELPGPPSAPQWLWAAGTPVSAPYPWAAVPAGVQAAWAPSVTAGLPPPWSCRPPPPGHPRAPPTWPAPPPPWGHHPTGEMPMPWGQLPNAARGESPHAWGWPHAWDKPTLHTWRHPPPCGGPHHPHPPGAAPPPARSAHT